MLVFIFNINSRPKSEKTEKPNKKPQKLTDIFEIYTNVFKQMFPNIFYICP